MKKTIKRIKENTYFPPKKQDYTIKSSSQYDVSNLIKQAVHSYSSQVTIFKHNKLVLNMQNKKDNKLIETLSVTKSLCALAIMFLIQDKKIDHEHDLISKYIKSWNYGKKKDITIKHILTHTSGLDNYWNYDEFMWPNGNYDDYMKGKLSTPNAKQISLVVDKDKPLDEVWRYNDIATQVIPTLVKQITKKDISRYLYRKLFKPLHIKYRWNHDDSGNSYGPNGLTINSFDLCKIGLLILNDGKYNKKLILHKSLIDRMVQPHIKSSQIKKDKMWKETDMTGYGYMWWRYNDLIISLGYLGQMLVIDKKNKVVGCRLIESKWDNKHFVKETEKDTLYFNGFKDFIKYLSTPQKTKRIKSKGVSIQKSKTIKYSRYRPRY